MQFRCLGPLRVIEDGRELPLGGPKQRLVLATLVLHANDEITADALVGAVWDGSAPASGRNSLHTYVSHLRKAIGAERIERRSQSYRLHADPTEIDSTRFAELVERARRVRPTDPDAASAALREALNLWSGPPFADLADATSLQAEITRLEQLHLAAIEERFSVDLDRGLSAELVADLESRVAAHPLRERLWAALMLALYRSGRQGDALAAYDRARAVLVEELGVDPSPELRQLHERILQQDPALEAGAPALKGYRLIERLGDDAGWTTWRAAQPGVDREVAIRAARPELANSPSFIRHFDLRAQRIARIEHPHVLPLYDFWREPDGAFVVTRLVTGGHLGRLLNDRPDAATRQRVADQLLRAVAAAHRGGVVHGRLTPEAVLLDERDNVALSGFPIVETAGGPLDTAPAGRATDEERFVAPERADGAPADTRADVYSLGVLLSELLQTDDEENGRVLARAVAADPSERPIDAERLLTALEHLRPGGTVSSRNGVPDALASAEATGLTRNPYKGLRAFTEADNDDFFGRLEVVARLLTALRAPDNGRFLALVGPSGSGKSSVVRAGLVPALRADALPGSADWYVVQMVPGAAPFDELAAALRQVAVDPPTDLAGALAGPAGIVGTVSDTLPDDSELLLIIDQLEELFTLVDAQLRRQFVDALVAAVRDASRRVRVVVTLRADFYDRPLAEPALAELMQTRTETIVPMGAAELEAAITRPAERVGVHVDGPLVAEMIAEVIDQPGALPLLQYALTELFDARTDGVLSVDAYRRIGGLTAALARRADGVYLGLPEVARAASRQLFWRLVTPGEGAEDTRRRATVAEVTALAPDQMGAVLTAFGDVRLLSFDRDPETREPTVEVAHEALLREWPRLRQWIDAARDDLRTQRRLHAAANDWEAAGRDTSFLATGSRLEQYGAWRSSSGITPTQLEGAYLTASVEHRDRLRADEAARQERERALERRSVRRLRVLVTVLAAAAVIGGALTVLAVTQADRAADQAEVAAEQADIAEKQANVATVRELSAASLANLDTDPELSMLLALEAVDRTRSVDGTVLPEAEEALHRALTSSRIEMRIPGIGGSADWSPAADEFVTEGPEDQGLVDIRDGTTGESVRSWTGHEIDINEVAYSPDGSVLATTGDDGAVRAWDPQTGDLLGEFVTEEAQVWAPAVSPDNALMAAIWPSLEGPRLYVIDIDSGEIVHDLEYQRPQDVEFHPDGDRLVVTERQSPGGAVVIDLATGEELYTVTFEHPTYGANFSPDGRWLAAYGPPAEIRLYDAEKGEHVSTTFGHTAPVWAVKWNADGSMMASASADATAKIWEVIDGEARQIHTLSSLDTRETVVGMGFSPDGKRFVTGHGIVDDALVWNIGASGDAEWANIASAVRTFAFAPLDEDRIVAAGPESVATMWDARSGEMLRVYGPDGPPARMVKASPDGAYVAAEMVEGDLQVFDGTTGERLWNTRYEGRDQIADLAVQSEPFRLVAVSYANTVSVFDRSGDITMTMRGDETREAANLELTTDGRMAAVNTFTTERQTEEDLGRTALYDLDTGERVDVLPTNGTADLAFGPDDELLAVARAGSGEIWSVDDREPRAAFATSPGSVIDTAFHPSGSEVATASQDGTVRLWDPETGVQRVELSAHDFQVHSVEYSLDGSMLISADNSGVIRSWATDIDDLVALAEDEVARDFTDEECRQYLHVESCAAARSE